MKIIIAGGSGFLGQSLKTYFESQNAKVIILTRNPQTPSDRAWDAKTLAPWKSELEHADAVINLTGKSVNCRYTPNNRAEILNSRVDSTRAIANAINQCAHPPRVWINASTATIYKHTFGNPHDETGEIAAHPDAHDAFSIEVAQAWEHALNETPTPGARKVAMRAAMVLGHAQNSVFPTLKRLTRLGLGGHMGNGRQYVSWIHENDFCRAIHWIIDHPELTGPINLAAPNPVTNREMMRLLRQILHVPIGLPATKWMLELGAIFLRTETELILKSRRVIPTRLLQSGFQFKFPEIQKAFQTLSNHAPPLIPSARSVLNPHPSQ